MEQIRNFDQLLQAALAHGRKGIAVARALGIETPKAACLAAVETVNPKMQATVDAACLCKMADRGAFPGAVVEGPWPWTTSSPPRLPGKRASTPRCPAMPTSSWPRPSRWPTPSPRP
ncbi:hypothetical protein [Brotocaccenecus cirricatena]|uniref:hypothetical protein n=1 Tax=Brotocaccenecus cirricatena TaxID=3064195 RepID=UPI0026753211